MAAVPFCLASCTGPQPPTKYKLNKPFKLTGVHNRVISGMDISGADADCVTLTQCSNITFINCRFRGSKKNGITLLTCRSIKITNCYFEQLASGVYAVEGGQINVSNNRFKNMQGPFPRGQMVQFDDVTGAGNKINHNTGENLPGVSFPEDAINLFKTQGTPASPVEVIGNRIRGGGPSKEGGGIMLGDNGGAYIIAKENILVDPGQYGMAIAGGNHITITANTIYGRQQAFTNVGIYIWNQHISGCALNTVTNNKVQWINATGEANPGWNQGNCGQTIGWDTNDWNAKISAAILPAKLINEAR